MGGAAGSAYAAPGHHSSRKTKFPTDILPVAGSQCLILNNPFDIAPSKLELGRQAPVSAGACG
jgi:hypothetical protein